MDKDEVIHVADLDTGVQVTQYYDKKRSMNYFEVTKVPNKKYLQR